MEKTEWRGKKTGFYSAKSSSLCAILGRKCTVSDSRVHIVC